MSEVSKLIDYLSSPATTHLENPFECDYGELLRRIGSYSWKIFSADDCADLAELKRLYQSLHPETRQGGFRGRAGKTNESGVPTFSQIIAGMCFCSVRTVDRASRIGERIGPEIRKRLRETRVLRDWIYRSRGELYALTHHDQEAQHEILDVIEADFTATVAEAEERLRKTAGSKVGADLRWRFKSRRKQLGREGVIALRSISTDAEPV